MKKTGSLKYTLPIFMSFYVMGFVDLVGVATGYVKQDFSLSDSIAQLLPGMVFVWFALLSIPTGIFQDRKGRRFTVNTALVITGIGLLIPVFNYSYMTAVLAFMVLGIGNTILQVSANPLLLDNSSEKNKAANLSLSQFIKAIASMLGPIIVAALAKYTGNWKLIFPLYAAITLLAFVWLFNVKPEESKPEKEPATFKTVIALLRNPFILIMVLTIFFLVGFEVALNSNIANFLKIKYSLSLESASLGISIYFASLMAGRFLGAILLRKFRARNFLVLSTIITLIGLAGLALINNINITLVLIFITGLGDSNIFPLIFALTVERKPEYANEISGLIIMAICGGAIIPPITGVLTDNFGAAACIYVMIACMLYVSYATYYLVKNK
jgi:FHS family L-fucose permease-like MFS transporter